MTIFLGILDVIVMFILVALVLMHSGKGGGLSDMLGGGAGATAMGSTAAERNLNRITFIVALAFVFLTVGLGLLMD